MADDERIIVILATLRSGTHFLRSVLENGTDIVNLGEPFNPDLTEPSPHSFGRYLRSAMRDDPQWCFHANRAKRIIAEYFEYLAGHGKGRPILVDIKDDQLRQTDWAPTEPARTPRLLSYILDRGYPIVRVVRRDLLAQHASIEFAKMTGHWVIGKGTHREKTAVPPIVLDIPRAIRHMRDVARTDANIRRWLDGHPRTVRLEYETLIDGDGLAATARAGIAQATGLSIDPAARAATEKIAPPLRELVANLDAVLDAMKGTDLARPGDGETN